MNKTYPGLHVGIGEVLTEEEIAKYQPKYPNGWNHLVFQPQTGLGLFYRSPLDEKLREVFTYKGVEMQFVDFWPTNIEGNPFNYIRASYTEYLGTGSYQLHTVLIHISKIDIESLKNMEIWQLISEELRNKLVSGDFADQNTKTQDIKCEVIINQKGRKRNPDYKNYPRELKCCTEDCEGKMPYISPTMLVKQSTLKNISIEEYVASWKCSRCEPRKKGRQSGKVNPDFAGIPHKTNCIICNKEVTIAPQNIIDKSKTLGITTEELVKNYKCRSCGGRISKSTTVDENGVITTTTNGFRGRKADPNSLWFGKTKELKCACGAILIQQPSQTYRMAEKLKITYEEYVAGWQCRECRKANPTTTTTTGRGRKPNPEFVGLPKTMSCKCGKEVASNLTYLKIKAEKEGTTILELIANYQCSKCRSGSLVEK